MNILKISLCALFVAALIAAARPCAAYQPAMRRDASYEQNLRYIASADTAITPSKVIRWMLSLKDPISQSTLLSKIEFQPIVHSNETQHEFIAQFAYKF
jgi:hypothetical protein